MSFRGVFGGCLGYVAMVLAGTALWAQTPAQPPSSSSSSSTTSKAAKKSASGAASPLNAGAVSAGVYRNAGFGFACKIPAGWVLRTDQMNAREDDGAKAGSGPAGAASGRTSRVLLAAFSRPPLAHGQDINSSVLIAAESVSSYSGLTIAAQYMATVSEIAKAQGFEVAEEPYEFAVGARTLARGDFVKNVGTRVMHQSTLVMLARGYAVSFTFIGGTDDEVEELVQGLSFGAAGKVVK